MTRTLRQLITEKFKISGPDYYALEYLLREAGKNNIADALEQHEENLTENKEKTNSMELIRRAVVRPRLYYEETQRKIFIEEMKRIDAYRQEIDSLASARDSELRNLEWELSGSDGLGSMSRLTPESRQKYREEVILKYDPKIRELYAKIKDERLRLNEKIEYLEKLFKKFKENPKGINKEEYKALYRTARLGLRERKNG